MRLLTTLLAGLLCHSLQASAAETSVADKLKQRLGPLLSKDAVLNFPSSDSWGRLTERWAGPLIHPDYIAVVEVATEADVQNAV